MNQTSQPTRKQPRLTTNHEREHSSAMERGHSLLDELDKAVLNLQRRFPNTSFRIEDLYGVPVRTAGNVNFDRLSEFGSSSVPISIGGRVFGRIRYVGTLDGLSNADQGPIVLSLIELEHWAQTESERRGEKVRKLLAEGMTPEVMRLLSLCGLDQHAGYTIVAMELTSPTDKFLYMDLLRAFMITRIWGYRANFEFVAYRPCGLLAIFPGLDESHWLQQLDVWIAEWKACQSALSAAGKTDVRACLTPVGALAQLAAGVRKLENTLQFANRWDLSGLIRPRGSDALTYILSNLTEHQISELVHRTLGPILVADHQDLLQTLRVYLRLDQNVAEAAKHLYVHRNTLLYRIRHIEDLLGLKLRNTAELAIVWSALEGLELLESSGHA